MADDFQMVYFEKMTALQLHHYFLIIISQKWDDTFSDLIIQPLFQFKKYSRTQNEKQLKFLVNCSRAGLRDIELSSIKFDKNISLLKCPQNTFASQQ